MISTKLVIPCTVAGVLMLAPASKADTLAIFNFDSNDLSATSLLAGLDSVTLSPANGLPASTDTDPSDNIIDDGSYLVANGLLYLERSGSSYGWGFANTLAPLEISLNANPSYNVTLESLTLSKLNTDGLGFTSSSIVFQIRLGDSAGTYGANASFSAGSEGSVTASLSAPLLIPAGTSATFRIDLNSGAGTSQQVIYDNFTLNGTAVVPEPTSAAVLLIGAAGLLAMRRRR